MFVEADIGNTRIKWRLRQGQATVISGVSATSNMFKSLGIDEVFMGVDWSSVTAVYVSSVVPRCHDALFMWFANFGLVPILAEVEGAWGDVTNAYRDVSQMGIDRWLALLAAYKKTQQTCLVVDAGSAVTVDLLGHNGRHYGGYIVPGLQAMNRSLFSDTDKVKVLEEEYPLEPSAGESTNDAVLSGLPLMVTGLVLQALQELDQKDANSGSPQIIVTGGDGAYFKSVFRQYHGFDVEYIPELVLDGLQLSISKSHVK